MPRTAACAWAGLCSKVAGIAWGKDFSARDMRALLQSGWVNGVWVRSAGDQLAGGGGVREADGAGQGDGVQDGE